MATKVLSGPMASGLLALLNEPSPPLQSFALTKLLTVVDTLWHEVAEALPELEALAEDDSLDPETRENAAAVASRVFFHLEEPHQALRLALEGSERNFDVVNDRKSLYVECLVSAAIDAYVKCRQREFDGDGGDKEEEDAIPVDKLAAVVDRMFLRCYADGQFKHALGVALEAREVEKVREVLEKSEGAEGELLDYVLKKSVTMMTSKSFRDEVLKVVADRFTLDKNRNPTSTTTCHQLLNQPEKVGTILSALLGGSESECLLGYQISFDLVDSGDSNFIARVAQCLPREGPNHAQALRVLTGGFPSELSLSFLHKNSNSDKLLMSNLKRTLEERGGSRNSVLHNCAVITHAYLNAGTTDDSFLRDNLDWMRKASNWAKFSATASLGVIHAGHTTEAMLLLEPYLPAEPEDETNSGVTASGGYAEGGSLYALGIIHGSHVGCDFKKKLEANELLRKHLRASHANEIISHGAALGVGLTAFGNKDVNIVNELKELLYTDSAVAGEAAGIAIGLVLVGTGTGSAEPNSEELLEVISELKNYARETQHEKIIRGISMALALMTYGQEENADEIIEEMRADRDPILRYGAMYALGLAYIGTGSNKAVRILLHTAVSDVSDDVRMAAVINLAFILYKTPSRVPQLVKLLLESFNPHVRYASCMAVGIAMAGTGDAESIALLEPMLEDMTDFVRQGALMGTAMLYMQQSDTCNNKKIKLFRDKLATMVGQKHQSTLTKMGATLATGLMDAGGRNCSIALGSRNGFTKMTTAVGLVLWLQHWHWYPMMHMLSLAITPEYTVGLNKDFKYPTTFQIQCNSKPSIFAYPKPLEEKKEEKKKRVETVTLSTTAKNVARLARKRAKEDAANPKEDGANTTDMEIDTNQTPVVEPPPTEQMEVDQPVEDKKKKKREPEPTSFQISNPSRITKSQVDVCQFIAEQRYRPIRMGAKPCGVLILTDSTPEDEEKDLETVKAPSLEGEDEANPPEPFEWDPNADVAEAVVADKEEPAAPL